MRGAKSKANKIEKLIYKMVCHVLVSRRRDQIRKK